MLAEMKPIFTLVFFLSLMHAQSLSYSVLPSGGAAPTGRVDGTIAYDSAGKQLFLFGGQDDQGLKNDLWSYSISERRSAQAGVTVVIAKILITNIMSTTELIFC